MPVLKDRKISQQRIEEALKISQHTFLNFLLTPQTTPCQQGIFLGLKMLKIAFLLNYK